MKKIVFLACVMIAITMAASAQVVIKSRIGAVRCGNSRINAVERNEIRRDIARTRTVQRIAQRDGVVTPRERMVVSRLKAETRRDIMRSKRTRF